MLNSIGRWGLAPCQPGRVDNVEVNSIHECSAFFREMAMMFAAAMPLGNSFASWTETKPAELRTESFVNTGLGQYVQPAMLRRFNDGGRYDDLLLKPNTELEETYRLAFASGIPEPYGPNCQYIYDQMNRPLGEKLQNSIVINSIDNNQPEAGKAEIRRIFPGGHSKCHQ